MSEKWSLACFLAVTASLFVVIVARRFSVAFRRHPTDHPLRRLRVVLGGARVGLGRAMLAFFGSFIVVELLGDALRIAAVFGIRTSATSLAVVDSLRDVVELATIFLLPLWALAVRRRSLPPGDPARARRSIALFCFALAASALATGPGKWTPGRAIASHVMAFLAPIDQLWIPRASLLLHFSICAVGAILVARGELGDPLGLAVGLFLRPLAPVGDPSRRAATSFGVRPEHRARTKEYRAAFARDGRVRISDLLKIDSARALAAEVPRAPFRLEMNSTVGATFPGAPPCAGYLATMTPDPNCANPSCRTLCRFGASLLEGELLEWLREITGMPALQNRPADDQLPTLAAQAHPKGGYIGPHTDHASHRGERVALAMIWHAVETWDESWGGLLRLHRKASGYVDEERVPRALRGYELDETWAPRFNELHVFALGAHRVHEVTLVTGDAVRFTIAGRLYDPPPIE